ncbi:MAG: hypothetical protein IKO83_03315 [Oscillospiraceae bacterium]|nr:hypothetical protein [Oscillospiraceae bacterium]
MTLFAAPCSVFAEVTDINQHKFLVELGRLLTFMSDEDRQEALMLYEKMFDDSDDEQALLQALVSPTRQAVIIARAYDANARMLQAYTNSQRKVGAHEAPEATPEFILAILKVYEEAVPLPAEPVEEPAAPAAPVEEEESVPEPNPDQISLFDPEEEKTGEPEPAEEAGEKAPAPDPLDEVDEFIAKFSIEGDELSPEAEDRSIPEEDAVDAPPAGTDEKTLSPAPEEERPVSRKRKMNVFLLILFILFAVPLTLVVVALLLIPTLISLVVSAFSIFGGCAAGVTAFGSWAVFADRLIVIGCALILLALGLLFLWLFIWFVATVIGGLVRWVIQLGNKWCNKEVAA